MKSKIKAFFWGMREFRNDWVVDPGRDLIRSYDAGRGLARLMFTRR